MAGSSNTLDQVPIGDSATVVSLHGRDADSLRLLEMGLVPGVRIHVVKRAPLGDPLELVLRGYHLSIRRAEARRIEVQLEAAGWRRDQLEAAGWRRDQLAAAGRGRDQR